MTQQERNDLAQAYQTMMDLAAWKHFDGILSIVESKAVADEDACPIATLSLAEIGECRGRRNAVRKIRSELNYILEGLK